MWVVSGEEILTQCGMMMGPNEMDARARCRDTREVGRGSRAQAHEMRERESESRHSLRELDRLGRESSLREISHALDAE